MLHSDNPCWALNQAALGCVAPSDFHIFPPGEYPSLWICKDVTPSRVSAEAPWGESRVSSRAVQKILNFWNIKKHCFISVSSVILSAPVSGPSICTFYLILRKFINDICPHKVFTGIYNVNLTNLNIMSKLSSPGWSLQRVNKCVCVCARAYKQL